MEGKSGQVPWDPEFYFVPGFTRYGLTRDGVLKNLSSNKLVQWVVFKGGGKKNILGGYLVASIYGDDGVRKGVSRHRLLALIFKPCPGNPKDFTVNHRDGIPGNDWLDNLEWATHAQNNQHAYDNGLRPNGTTPVRLRYWRTGEECFFISIAECARALNRPVPSLEQRLRRNPGVAYEDGLQLKLDDDTPWVSPETQIAKVRVNRAVAAKDIETGRVIVHESISALASFLDLSKHFIKKHLSSNNAYLGYYFREVGSELTWPTDN